jgi:hypothetical protein
MDRHFLEAISAHIVAGAETPEETQQFRALLPAEGGRLRRYLVQNESERF